MPTDFIPAGSRRIPFDMEFYSCCFTDWIVDWMLWTEGYGVDPLEVEDFDEESNSLFCMDLIGETGQTIQSQNLHAATLQKFLFSSITCY